MHVVTIHEKGRVNLKENKEGYMGGDLEGRKGREKCSYVIITKIKIVKNYFAITSCILPDHIELN